MAHRPGGFLRNTAVISSLTMVSRLLGLVRDMACASILGAGLVMDAFSFAFRVPNLFRKLFGEGALGAAFIPAFTDHFAHNRRQAAQRLAGVTGAALLLVLVSCVLVGEALAIAIPAFADLEPRWTLALALTALLLPYLALVCLTALAGSILNAMGRFGAPAAAPIILNVCWIVSLAVVAPLVSHDPAAQVYVLAGGILVAGVCQLGLQLVALRRRGFEWKLRLDLKDPGLRGVAGRMGPIVLGLAAVQLNVLLDGVIAISLAAPPGKTTFELFGGEIAYPMLQGANSILYYGNRLMQFPLGVFGIALATAIFPALSTHASRKDWEGFSDTVTEGLSMVLLVGLPAGAGLIVIAQPLIELVYQHGAFAAEQTMRTVGVLSAYSVGLWAYCASHVLARAYYGLKNTRTPLKITVWAVVLNLALNLVLIWPMRESGLAYATAISAAAQCAALYIGLVHSGRLRDQHRLLHVLFKAGAATAVMYAAVVVALHMLPPAGGDAGLGTQFVRVVAPVAVGVTVFVGMAAALRVRELRPAWDAIRRRIWPH